MYGQTQAQAEAKAAMLCARLGANWEPRVWENCGWCYSAVLGGLYVNESNYPRQTHRYSAYLNEPGKGGGIWAESADTPHDAVQAVLDAAQDEVDHKASVIQQARTALSMSIRVDLAIIHDNQTGFGG